MLLVLRQFSAAQVAFRGVGRFSTQDVESENCPIKDGALHHVPKGGFGAGATARTLLAQRQFVTSPAHLEAVALMEMRKQAAARGPRRAGRGKENAT
jgi:hypothetical protein